MSPEKYKKIVYDRLVAAYSNMKHAPVSAETAFRSSDPVKRLYYRMQRIYRKVGAVRLFRSKYHVRDFLAPLMRPTKKYAKKWYLKLKR